MPFRSALAVFTLAALLTAGCDDSSTNGDDEASAELVLVEDLEATSDVNYTFYDLDDSTVVEDSTSSEWDLGFQATMIIVNSGESGPGSAEAALHTGVFDDMLAVPGDAAFSAGGGLDDPAIPTGSGTGWYSYSGPPNHLITPIPGRVILVRTSEGNYAKLRILSYYRGNPDEPGSTDARYYTFEYVISDDTSFE